MDKSEMRQILIIAITLLICSAVSGQTVQVSMGQVKRHEKFTSKYVDARNVDVWLPDGYSDKKRYAVLYMHDGQMLYDAATSWNKQAWEVDETVGKLIKEKRIKDCIVVGVWNNGLKRHLEYFPQKAWHLLSEEARQTILKESQPGLLTREPISDNYLKFLVEELKPFIDKTYSTRTDRANTFVAGSSMGGLISMYAISEYPEIFGGAACISTHWPGLRGGDNNPVPAAFFAYMKAHLPAPKTHRIYFDYGDQTLDALYPPLQKQADDVMKSKKFTANNWITRFFPGENHSEASWSKRFDIPLLFLMKR
jgi:predicted alpha/beta superfamily hydrolase